MNIYSAAANVKAAPSTEINRHAYAYQACDTVFCYGCSTLLSKLIIIT